MAIKLGEAEEMLSPLRWKKIVAVDDSPIVLMTLEKVLGNISNLHCFSRGSRALQFLKTFLPDLIILDIDMPTPDGYEMLKLIRGEEHLTQVPVIFLTSSKEKNCVVQAIEAGAQDYCIKPVDEEILIAKVSALIL